MYRHTLIPSGVRNYSAANSSIDHCSVCCCRIGCCVGLGHLFIFMTLLKAIFVVALSSFVFAFVAT